MDVGGDGIHRLALAAGVNMVVFEIAGRAEKRPMDNALVGA